MAEPGGGTPDKKKKGRSTEDASKSKGDDATKSKGKSSSSKDKKRKKDKKDEGSDDPGAKKPSKKSSKRGKDETSAPPELDGDSEGGVKKSGSRTRTRKEKDSVPSTPSGSQLATQPEPAPRVAQAPAAAPEKKKPVTYDVPPGECPFQWGAIDSDLSTSFSSYDVCSRSLSIDNLEELERVHKHTEPDLDDLPPPVKKGTFQATFSDVSGMLPPGAQLKVTRFKREKQSKKGEIVTVDAYNAATISYGKAKKSTSIDVALLTAGRPFAGVLKKLRDLDLSSGQSEVWTLELREKVPNLGDFAGPYSVTVTYSYAAGE